MLELKQCIKDTLKKITQAESKEILESLRIEMSGKKGYITQAFSKLGTLQGVEKKEVAAS